VYGLILDDSALLGAADVMKELTNLGVGTRPFFYPMHQQPVLKRMGFFKGEEYPVAERISEQGFYIPSGIALNEEKINRVASIVRKVIYF